MALVKCPDCGKMVSSRVSNCPDCGCPAEYFEHEETASSESVSSIDKFNSGFSDAKNDSDDASEKNECDGNIYSDNDLSFQEKNIINNSRSFDDIINDNNSRLEESFNPTYDDSLKTEYDLELDSKGLNTINLEDPSVENYIKFRDFQMKNDLMDITMMPMDAFYKNIFQVFLVTCGLAKGIHSDNRLLSSIPYDVSYNEFFKYILLDIRNLQAMKFSQLYIKEVNISDEYPIIEKQFSKLEKKTKINISDIIIYQSTGIISFDGFVMTDKYVMSIKNKTIINNADIVSIEYSKSKKNEFADRIIISSNNDSIEVVPIYLPLDYMDRIPFKLREATSAQRNAYKNKLEKIQGIYYTNLIKSILIRWGNNSILSI